MSHLRRRVAPVLHLAEQLCLYLGHTLLMVRRWQQVAIQVEGQLNRTVSSEFHDCPRGKALLDP